MTDAWDPRSENVTLTTLVAEYDLTSSTSGLLLQMTADKL
jgi:hypothetical protein